MNADTYALLTSVLIDKPCTDPCLQETIETTPFAIYSIAQQCYFILHVISLTRSLLYDEPSAYSQTLQQLVDKLPSDDSDAPICPPLPSQNPKTSHFSEADANDTTLPSGMRSPRRRPVGEVSTTSMSSCSMQGMSLSSAPVPKVLPVVPSCSLDLSVTIVGGGTVVRELLHILLDQHPSFIHPTRITVITRQPEKLNIFATRGVLCLNRKHGTEALNDCHALILACQPAQLDDFIQNHFSAKAFGNDPLHQIAKLKPSTIVVSCLAAYRTVRLAALLNHEERLIIRPTVDSLCALPEIADEHVYDEKNCMDARIQRMIDQDSFLRKAVAEAHNNQVDEAVRRLLVYGSERNMGKNSSLPAELAQRAALYQVIQNDRAKYTTISPTECLIELGNPSYEFFLTVWAALQVYVAKELEMHEGEKRKGIQQGEGQSGTLGYKGIKLLPTLALKKKASKQEAQKEAKQSEGPFLCAALSMLPQSVHSTIVQQVVERYHPSSAHKGVFSSLDCPSTERSSSELTAVSATTGQNAVLNLNRVAHSALRRLSTLYPIEVRFVDDLQEHYRVILRQEEASKSKLIDSI